ncbi:hypothetical protein BSL82_18905 (plasmid) [Tardibacter chloracetimidivorans]|uniref:CD-NTase-associated protein 12/Pycsar effector protein TIR domain-containing protein n=2 Tax=Sphingomonadaceae TaxID=41297 RepID=A0A2A4FPG9_9SPHN|nr:MULTISPECIES: hypothetical protein [Sphingomonadaceae]API61507.1 hypothetical protein BSL82_18905 [Tardibacter chloracetimidivorans]PCE40303.1 hypothetical protein COO09_20715 [Rhizorhabdus dicambivorans]
MGTTVFWSWQSDLDGRVTREVIRYALDEAIAILAADLEEADRPGLTSDTQGVAGSPDIVATIYRKIDEAAVFVGDVTPIAVSESGKACANPNVLLEMGYANRALTEHRVIQVWNTAFDGAVLDKLPFDMRGRRGPIGFDLPPGTDTAELRRVRGDLAKQLAAALKLSLDQLPPPPPEAVHWQPHFSGDADLWFDRAEPQLVTNTAHGTSKLRWMDRFPGYARLIPSKWTPKAGAKQAIANHPGHPALLARANSLSYGISRGGALVYWPGTAEDGVYPTVAITQWFEKTGEFWGVGGGFLFERDGRVRLATGYFFHHWLEFLKRNTRLALEHGGSLPIHVRLGVNGLSGSWWPRGRYDFGDEGFAAVEESYEYVATLTSVAADYLQQVAVDAFNGLAGVYGVEPHSYDQIVALSK